MMTRKFKGKMQRCLFTTAVLLMILFPVVLVAEETVDLERETDRISYSLGQQIGKDLKKMGLDLDAAALVQGFKDASGGAEPVLTQQEMNTILSSLKGGINAAQRESARERYERKKKEAEDKRRKGQEFLAENVSKPGVKTLPSGLQYKMLTSGSGQKPGPKDVVILKYRARTIAGHEFDNSDNGEDPARFHVDKVIRGLTEALQLMREGARWELYLPPELAFGRRGPLADQTVIYEVELIGIGEDSLAAESQMAPSEKTQ